MFCLEAMTLEEIKDVSKTFLWFSLHTIKSIFLNTRYAYKELNGEDLLIDFNERTYVFNDIRYAMTAVIILITGIFLSLAWHNYIFLVLIAFVWVFF